MRILDYGVSCLPASGGDPRCLATQKYSYKVSIAFRPLKLFLALFTCGHASVTCSSGETRSQTFPLSLMKVSENPPLPMLHWQRVQAQLLALF